MKKNLKSIVALLLAIMMSFQMTAFVTADEAAATEEVVEEKYVVQNMREFEILNALGIFTIFNKNDFTGDKVVTREEAAAIAGRMIGLIKGYSMEGKEMPFTDVEDTDIYAYEIYHMNNLGIMTGYAGEFNPKGGITEEQFVKVVVEALGYGAEAQSMGGYPHGYTITAGKYGMLNEVKFGGPVPLTQDVAVRIIYNCLDIETPKVISVENGGFMTTVGKTIMSQYFDAARGYGIVTRDSKTHLGVSTASKEGTIQIGKDFYYTGSVNCDSLVGYNVEFIYKKSAEDQLGTILYIAPWLNDVTHVEAKDVISYFNYNYTIYENNKEKVVKIPRTAKIIYNGVHVKPGFTNFVPEIGYVDFIDNNEDGVIDTVYILSYELYEVEGNNKSTCIISAKGNKKINYKDASWHVVGDAGQFLPAANVEDDKFLFAISENGKVINGFVVTGYVEGTVESIFSEGRSDYLVINGVEYKASSYCAGLIGTTVKPASKVGFYVYENLLLVQDQPSSSLVDSVGYLIEAGKADGSFDTRVYLRMMLQTGEVTIVDVAEKAKLVCYGRADVTEPKDFITNLTHELKIYNSNDANDAPSGESQFVVRQPVIYRLNAEGKIDYLEIAPGHNYSDAIDYMSNTDGFQMTRLFRHPYTRFNSYLRHIGMAGADGEQILDYDAWVISVPTTAEWDNFEGYAIEKVIDLGLAYKDKDKDTLEEPWRLYRTGNDINGANIAVTTDFLESSGGGSTRMIVEKIAESTTDDGVPCYMLQGQYLDLTPASVKTMDKTVLDSMNPYTVTPGDLVTASLNSDELATKVTINYDNENAVIVSNPGSYIALGTWIMGGTPVVEKNHILSVYQGIPTSLDSIVSTDMFMTDVRWFDIVVFDPTLERADSLLVEASAADIVKFADNPSAASKLFIVYQDSDPRLMVIYNK